MLGHCHLGTLFLIFCVAGCAVESGGLKGAGGEAGAGSTGGAAGAGGTAGTGGVGAAGGTAGTGGVGGVGGTAGTGGVGGAGGTGGLSCVFDEDCPEPELGDWSECEFESDCAEEGTRSRNVRTYGCVEQLCLATDTPKTEPCQREAEGLPCGLVRDCKPLPGQECTLPPDASFCEEAGTIEVECTRFECSAGVCTEYAEGQESQACEVDTDGKRCGLIVACDCNCGEPDCPGPLQCNRELRLCADGTCVIESITPYEFQCPV